MVDFAALRAANIANNKALLIELGLEKPIIPQQSRKRKVDDASKDVNKPAKARRKARDATGPNASLEEEASKARRKARDASGPDASLEEEASKASSGRRSLRNANKAAINYDESVDKAPPLVSRVAVLESGREHIGNKLGKRLHNPKTFGQIPGIEVGTWWETRAECSTDAVHAPFVAGIAGSAADGAYSVTLSGGYDDDVDLGYAFTYTGSGGRDLKGTKTNPKNLRTAPQSHDQTFENPMNAALKRSVETKKPVRVIRGFKCKSPYAPESGYRYDGLYTVEKAWLEPGLNKNGYKVCKYAFKRIPGQAPLPVAVDERDDSESSKEEKEEEEEEEEGEEARSTADENE